MSRVATAVLVSQAADLAGDDQEAQAHRLTGLLGLDRRVDRQEVGLVRHLGDGGDRQVGVRGALADDRELGADRGGRLGELPHRPAHLGEAPLPFAGHGRGVVGDLADLVHGLEQFEAGGRDR